MRCSPSPPLHSENHNFPTPPGLFFPLFARGLAIPMGEPTTPSELPCSQRSRTGDDRHKKTWHNLGSTYVGTSRARNQENRRQH